MFLEQDVSEVCQKSERLKDVCNNDEMASFFGPPCIASFMLLHVA